MNFVVEHTDGRRESGHQEEENMTLGLGGSLLPCICGVRVFVDPFSDKPPDERPPDRTCTGCGRKWWYYDDEQDTAGYLGAEVASAPADNEGVETNPHQRGFPPHIESLKQSGTRVEPPVTSSPTQEES